MSDKINKLTNVVKLTGKITEVETKLGTTKEKKIPYVSIKGAIQFGDSKAQSRRFETYVQQTNKEGKENKLYDPTVTFAKNVKSVAKAGNDEATIVEIQGNLEANDYVNQQEKLVEGLNVKATFFNDVDADAKFKGTADIEGYIQSITDETKGDDSKETGRLRMTLLTTDFFGNLVPVKNIIVPAELKDDFQSTYEVGQTATFFVDYVVNKTEDKPKKTGGLGVQRTTDGKTFVEMVITGANPPIDADDELAISSEAIRIALAERKAKINELKEQGYQGTKSGASISSASDSNRNGIAGGKNKPKPVENDEDIPF